MLHHPKWGSLVPSKKKYKRLGNSIVQLYVDKMGVERELDGTETSEPPKITLNQEIKEAKIEKKQESRHGEVFKGLKDLKTAIESQTKTEKESILGVLEDIKSKDFPKPIDFTEKLDEISSKISKLDEKSYIKEFESIKKAVLSLDREIDLKPVVRAVENIKFPAIPKPTEPKNYTKLLEDIKKSLPKETDTTPIVKAIKEIPQFEIPSEMIRKGRLKVEVDRTGGGEGGAPSPFEDASGGAVKAKVVEGNLQVDVVNQLKDYQTQEVDDYTTTNVTYVCQMKSDGTWLFKKIDETGTFPTFRYANVSNNATKTTYALALADRTTLTYGYLNTLTI